MLKIINPNDLLEFLKERRSIRFFQDKMISDEELEMILEAGRWAPSASNRQPWELIIIKNREILGKIAGRYSRFLETVPVAIAIIGKPVKSPKWYVIDTSLVSMNMMLMAWSMGIGSCWLGSLNRDKVKELLELGPNDFVLTVLPFGYIKGRMPKPRLRKDLKKITREFK